LKQELEGLAVLGGESLSEYLRAVLAWHLLGSGDYRCWQAELARVHQEAKAHERG
jgi:hypothetical protein